ncbi:MAG TPA: fatty acyl-AMP ligase [Ktedonobacteraceae bacterium]|nr:fatty acyl-AMP ligase [Ktedonobacteraceae bacterium]
MSSTLASSALEIDTLVHRLRRHALEQPEQIGYTFLRYSEAGNQSLTYGELDLHARLISTQLRKKGASGKPVLLLFPSGLEYIAAYFGCLYAGAIAVPAYTPHSARDLPRIQAIVADARADIVLTTTEEYTKTTRWIKKAPDLARLTWIATDSLNICEAELWQGSSIDESALAFLQYTSGSTRTPRGVMVSHGNIMHNLAAIHAHWKVDETAHPVGVYWLPIFHDMGLIMGILSPLYSGYPVYFMSPADFLQRPARWLQAISDYRGTFSCAPNFAYELCLRRTSEEELTNLDLSCWEGTGNGAEPVRSSTLERFIQRFSACGFPHTAFRPGYGLAEATLIVTTRYKQEPTAIKTISKQRLEEGYVEAASSVRNDAKQIVGCGQSIDNQSIVIVNPETLQRCESSQVGEIWIAGPSVAQGYWQRPEETASVFQAHLATGEGPFLRTGDLGVFQDENLFITGRLKDLIVIGGRNLYPQDIEITVEQAHPAIIAGHCAAFSYEHEGEERLIILAEVNHRYRPQTNLSSTGEFSQVDMQEIIKSVRRAVAEQHEVRAHQILLLKIGGMLKTSSGKLQRSACRKAFLQGILKTWNSQEPVGV